MSKLAQTTAGLAITVVLLWFLFSDTDWLKLKIVLLDIRLGWLLTAIVLVIVSLLARVQRWSYVVRATTDSNFRPLFSATQIGMLVNSIIPARLGDFARGFVLARLLKISFSKSISLVALDRINDVLALLAVLLTTLLVFPRHEDISFSPGTFGNAETLVVSSDIIQPVAVILAMALTGLIITLVVLYFRQGLIFRFIEFSCGWLSEKFANSISGMFKNFAEGMHIFRSISDMSKSIFFSLLTWGLVAGSITALCHAFSLELPWYTSLLTLSILGVFTSVTVTPGMVGQYHIPVVASLLMVEPTLPADTAKAFAIVAHLIALLPTVILGLYALNIEKLGFSDLLRQVSSK